MNESMKEQKQKIKEKQELMLETIKQQVAI